ncbi:MAG: hypothetical protein Q9170_004185 [Blastenia crenularia]
MEEMSKAGDTFEVVLQYLAWSTDIAFLYLENKRPGLLKDEKKARAWAEALSSIVESLIIQKQIPLFTPMVFSLPEWLVKAVSSTLFCFVEIHKDMKSSANSALAARSGTSAEHKKPLDPCTEPTKPDVYQTIIESDLPPPEKEAGRIAQEVFTLLFAGSSSTARVMARATFHLASNPPMMDRLRQELKTVMDDPSEVSELEHLEALPYLTAVIKESLRMTGLVSSRSPLISPNEPLRYGTWDIPAKTPVSMTLSSIHTNPSIFPDPYAFLPERWLGTPDEQARLEKFFVPFGRGQRMCFGINLAWAQLYIGAASVFSQFDFELDGDMDRRRDVDITRDCFLGEPSRRSRGIRVKVRKAV